MTHHSDDYEAHPRSLREIEDHAAAYVAQSGLLDGDWIDPFEMMSSLGFKDEVLSTKSMQGAHSLANAKVNTISMTWQMSRGLRMDSESYRYIWAHEVGHLAMHRGPGLKARKQGTGNKSFTFLARDKSAEFQAWLFARALLLPRSILGDGGDEELAYRFGIPVYAVEKRRDDIELDASGELFKR